MRSTIVAVLALFVGAVMATAQQIPRPSPDFVVQMGGGKQLKISDFRGKVLCFVFILTT